MWNYFGWGAVETNLFLWFSYTCTNVSTVETIVSIFRSVVENATRHFIYVTFCFVSGINGGKLKIILKSKSI